MTKRGLLILVTALVLSGWLFPALAAAPLRVGVYQNPPLVGYDRNGRGEGFFPELFSQVAQLEGWTLDYVPGSWDECLRRLDAGTIDLVLAMAHSPERAQRYVLSNETIFSNWGQVIARSEAKIETLLDLDGKSVAVMKGNIHYDGPHGLKLMAEKFALRLRVVECSDYVAVVDAVRRGKADAGLVSRLETLGNGDTAHLKKTPILLSPVSLRIAFAKNTDPRWLAAFDAHLREWKQDPHSVYHRLLEQWISGEKGYTPPSWLLPTLRIMGVSLTLLLVVAVLGRIQVRRGLREVSCKNRLLEQEVAERRQAQEALDRQKTFFETALNSVPDGLFLCNPDGEIVRCNPGMTRIFGYQARELLGQQASVLYARHDEFGQQCRMRVDLSIEEQARPFVVNYRRKDGTVFPGETLGTVVAAADGEILGYLGSMRDITERHRSREALQWELKVNRAIAELSRLLLRSSSMEEISHVILAEAKELTGSAQGFVGFIDPRTGAMVSPTMSREMWEACQVPDKKFVFHRFRGLWGWVLSHRQPILCNEPETDHRSTGIPEGHVAIRRFIGAPAMADGELLGIIALANSDRDYHAKDLDLLERLAFMYALAVRNMRSAQAIRESEERFRAIFEHAGVGMATIAPDGRYLQVNPAYCRLLGYAPDEFDSLSVGDLTHPDDLAVTLAHYEDIRQGRKRFFSYEKRFVHKDGREIWGAVTVAWLMDEDGRPAYGVALVQDVTEKKLAELRLLENEERFKHLAHHDSLTGLPNRLLFADRLHHAMSKARRGGSLLALLFFDLDRFKAINDSHGHEAGDEVLRAVAKRLTGIVRDADTVARFGGDEFIMLLEDVADVASVEHLAGKVLAALARPLAVGELSFTITSSIGISLFPTDGEDGETLIRKADDAMFRAKQQGRNLFLFSDADAVAAASER